MISTPMPRWSLCTAGSTSPRQLSRERERQRCCPTATGSALRAKSALLRRIAVCRVTPASLRRVRGRERRHLLCFAARLWGCRRLGRAVAAVEGAGDQPHELLVLAHPAKRRSHPSLAGVKAKARAARAATMARSDALSAVQPFVDSVIKSLVSEYEDKLSSKQEYLDRLVREAQDARELNEALSSQCVARLTHMTSVHHHHLLRLALQSSYDVGEMLIVKCRGKALAAPRHARQCRGGCVHVYGRSGPPAEQRSHAFFKWRGVRGLLCGCGVRVACSCAVRRTRVEHYRHDGTHRVSGWFGQQAPL